MAVGDVLQVTVLGTLHGQTIQNVLHYYESTSGAGNNAVGLAQTAGSSVGGTFRTNLAAEYTYQGTMAQKIWPLPKTLSATDTTAAGAGDIASNSLPSSVAATITKQTSLAGHRFRGRIYVGGVPSSYENDSQLSAAGLAGIGAIATAIETPLSANGFTWTPVLWHRDTNAFTFVVNALARSILRVQRRRQVGRGS